MAENLIYSKIADVMADIGAIGKDSRNNTQNFMYRGIDAVMNALNPALTKHKVFVVPEVLEQSREERVNSKGTTLIYSIMRIKYRFFAEDGSFVETTVVGEGMDTGDKASNKAMSVAFKYACFQTFCIPTEEMVDPDSECHEVAPKVPQPTELKVGAGHIATIKAECERTKLALGVVLKTYGLNAIEDMTMEQFNNAMAKFKVTASK